VIRTATLRCALLLALTTPVAPEFCLQGCEERVTVEWCQPVRAAQGYVTVRRQVLLRGAPIGPPRVRTFAAFPEDEIPGLCAVGAWSGYLPCPPETGSGGPP